jgi:hypothetical protein
MVPHSRCGGVDRAAIIRAEEKREWDKHWITRKTMVVVTTEVNIYNNTEDEMEILQRTLTCPQCYSFRTRIAYAFDVLIR